MEITKEIQYFENAKSIDGYRSKVTNTRDKEIFYK